MITDRDHLRQAIVTLLRNAWKANAKAAELEATYLLKYGTRGQKAKVQAEIVAMHTEALDQAIPEPLDEADDLAVAFKLAAAGLEAVLAKKGRS